MTVLQHYYTSFSNPTTGLVGFQCKGMSPGISSEDLKTLNSLIGYRIPPSLVDNPINAHPIAFRYFYINHKKCFLVCSQSNGNDENGRPGNFFSHSILTTPEYFDVFPPIMYWKHSFWRDRDDSSNEVIQPLPVFDLDPSLDLEQIWPFLEASERRNWYYKILCAVVQYDQTKRPIIILDSVDNIALWIFAVTASLPQRVRKYISFATYHHDPYAGLFLITGTTADSKFHFSPDEYLTYFVLNTEQNRVSEIPDSGYARYVWENFLPEQYENKLLDFFHMCDERLPPNQPKHMNATLNAITNFYQTIRERSLSLPNPLAQESLHHFIASLQQKKIVDDEDLEDLISTLDVLKNQIVISPDLAIVEEYGKALQLLKNFYPSYLNRIQEDTSLLIKVVLYGKEDNVGFLISTMDKIYPLDNITQAFSKSDKLSYIVNEAKEKPLDDHSLIWKYLVPFIRFDNRTKPYISSLLEATFQVSEKCTSQNDNKPQLEVDQLFTTIIESTKEHHPFLLETSISIKSENFRWVQRYLYYKIIENMSLSERKPYRDLERSIEPEIELYEVSCDIHCRGPERVIQTLVEWIEDQGTDRSKIIAIVSKGLDTAWSIVPQGNREKFSESILSNPVIEPHLNNEWNNKLVSTYFPERNFHILGRVPFKLYEQYYTHSILNPKQRAIIGGSLAMTTGRFYRKSVADINSYLSKMDTTTYENESKKLMESFFARALRLDTHIELLRTTFVRKHQNTFWDLYWSNFKSLMLDMNRSKEFINLLTFWFDDSFQVFSDLPYVGQGFFLELPMVMEEARKEKSFSRIANQINREAKNQPWYPLVEQLFSGKQRKRILGFIKR
jgi:hypothetical protein